MALMRVMTPNASCDLMRGRSNPQILCVDLGDSLVIGSGSNAVTSQISKCAQHQLLHVGARGNRLTIEHVPCSSFTTGHLWPHFSRAVPAPTCLSAVERQVSAILLCSVNRPLYAHTDTDRNPADADFRSAEFLAEKLRWSEEPQISVLLTLSFNNVFRHVVCEAPSGNCEIKHVLVNAVARR